MLRAKGEKEKRENNVCKVYKRSSKKHVKEKKKGREREKGESQLERFLYELRLPRHSNAEPMSK